MLNTPQNPLKQRLKKAFIVLITIYLMVGSLLYFFQEKIMFLPTTLEENYAYQFSYPFEELFFNTEDNAIINAIHFKVEQPKGVVLFFHGNAGDLSRWGTLAEYFVKKKYDVLVMDYRTYGKSKGKLTEKALYHDAQYCYDYLKARYNEDAITIYGRSLGTGIATNIASLNHPKQLILETPFYSVLDVAQSRFPIFPIKPFLKYKMPSYQFVKETDCPILMLHGTDDRVVPYESAKKLFEASPKKNTTFVTFEGGRHSNLSAFDSYHYNMEMMLN
ncbi:MAG: alpha/beta fold hydrolase [Algibacter sp.]|uniref:alpha/beta hydrolase n=1 Tax=Algibacter sp. TaxID=1872428 RepID=UPI0026306A6E|nr:alpha/beta fold hydrolase [Algibacter sp.]MDG1730663.1 alpha/beta fold hydrolase [Algibacter sp.]MDG2177614.1 alpha/beta fold hydrolase [Algibacter sp.]